MSHRTSFSPQPAPMMQIMDMEISLVSRETLISTLHQKTATDPMRGSYESQQRSWDSPPQYVHIRCHHGRPATLSPTQPVFHRS